MDQLNTIFMHDGESNDLARVAFITTLRGMFTDPLVDPRLRQAIDDFLDSVDSFLDLLLGLRDLPAGEQYQDDRTVGTLRLLNLIRRIGGRNATCAFVDGGTRRLLPLCSSLTSPAFCP